MDAQRKVTCFVTRRTGDAAELLVFHHAGGLQVPAGTVEDDEDFDAAAWREVGEETGLHDLDLLAYLGARSYDLRGAWSTLRRDVDLLSAPMPEARPTLRRLERANNVTVLERQGGFAHVVYEEHYLEPPSGRVSLRLEGWLAESDLFEEQERRFFHFRAPPDSPEEWQVIEGGRHEFNLHWLPLKPKARLLPANQAWLDEFQEMLVLAASQE